MASVSLNSVTKKFGTDLVLDEVNLEIADGEFMVIVGSSGSGKSTLLRSIAGLEFVDQGNILVGDVDVTHHHPAARQIAMVFQNYALYPHMTVFQNMAFALKAAGMRRSDYDSVVNNVASRLQIAHLLARYPRELSGGQRQRVAIGRAMVRQPKVFLFDEPLSNLDAALRVQMRIELAKLHHELGVTMIYVTHDQTEAMTLGDRICVLNRGKIEQVGTPVEVYFEPQTQFVAGFIGSPAMNFMPVSVVTAVQGLASFNRTRTIHPAATTIGIRAENIRIGSEGISGELVHLENLGEHRIGYVKIPGFDCLLVIKLLSNDASADHSSVKIYWDARHELAFSADGLRLANTDNN
jgi:multiple sugar transport system ATP-binding protein